MTTKDRYTHYEMGLNELLRRIAPGHAHYFDMVNCKQQLQEHIERCRHAGESDALLQERAEMIDHLNNLALSALGLSFEDMCMQLAAAEASNRARRPSIFFCPSSFSSYTQPLVGRDDVLANVRHILCSSSTPVRLVLNGVPGVGKTHLVAALADDPVIWQQFPGGVLATSLGKEPHTVALLRAWDAATKLPSDPHLTVSQQLERIAHVFEQQKQPGLWIVDDVWSSDDAQLFASNNPYVTILFTSNQQDQAQQPVVQGLPADVTSIQIPPLDEASAVTLLRQCAGIPEPEHTEACESLAALVGGVPLILTLLGAFLQRFNDQPDWFEPTIRALKEAARQMNLPTGTIDDATRFVQRGMMNWIAQVVRKPARPQPLNPKAIIELCVGNLPGLLTTTFVRMAAFAPDPISFDLRSAFEIAENQNRDEYDLLVTYNLLSCGEDGQFWMHRMLAEWVESDKRHYREVRMARQRLARWHVRLLQPEHLREFLVWRTHPDNWQQLIYVWKELLVEPEMLREWLTILVPVLIDHGDYDAVRTGLERGLSVFREDSTLLAETNYCLGLVDHRLGHYQAAADYTKTALLHFQIAHNQRGQAAALTLLGHIERDMGNGDAARDCYQQALANTSEDDVVNYAGCLANLASLLQSQGKSEVARPLFEKAQALQKQVAEANRAAVAEATRRVPPAPSARGTGNPQETIATLDSQAHQKFIDGSYEEARTLFARSLELREQELDANNPSIGIALGNLATVLVSLGDYAAARPLLERALSIIEQQMGADHDYAEATRSSLADVLDNLGETDAASALREQSEPSPGTQKAKSSARPQSSRRRKKK